MQRCLAILAACTALIAASAVRAETDAPAITLILKDHVFTPNAVTVPGGQRIRVELKNQDSTAEEFDSDDLHVEKDVAPHGKVVFQIGPLKPGTYHFVGELHVGTASGTITAVTAP
jgi:heme/copper-type cytochrome/quinol oxidase subunit 2